MKVLAAARVAALALALLPLAACADDDRGPVVLPPAKSSTPASSTGSSPAGSEESSKPRKPRKPGEFDEATKRSAEEFVRDYWKTLTMTSQGKQDVQKLRRYYANTCAICSEFYRETKELRDKHQRVIGSEQVVLSSEFESHTQQRALVNVIAQSTPGRLVDANEKVLHSYSGGEGIRYIFELRPRQSSWQIISITHLGAA